MPKQKILFVDDELDFLEIMKQRLESWGYEIITASAGNEALDILAGKKIDIVILDYIMPGMDGVAVLKEIRRKDAKIPVIMFTAHPDTNAIKGTEKLGVTSFIPKFSTYSDVQASLKTALDLAAKTLNRKGEVEK